jgi:hypothetical protein
MHAILAVAAQVKYLCDAKDAQLAEARGALAAVAAGKIAEMLDGAKSAAVAGAATAAAAAKGSAAAFHWTADASSAQDIQSAVVVAGSTTKAAVTGASGVGTRVNGTGETPSPSVLDDLTVAERSAPDAGGATSDAAAATATNETARLAESADKNADTLAAAPGAVGVRPEAAAAVAQAARDAVAEAGAP